MHWFFMHENAVISIVVEDLSKIAIKHANVYRVLAGRT